MQPATATTHAMNEQNAKQEPPKKPYMPDASRAMSCPFCGGDDIALSLGDPGAPYPGGYFTIECINQDCPCEVNVSIKRRTDKEGAEVAAWEEALAMWNTRPAITPADAPTTNASIPLAAPETDALRSELSHSSEDGLSLLARMTKHARKLERTIATLTAELAEAMKDGERLDWLEKHRPWVHNAASGYTTSFGANDPYWGLAPRGSETIYGNTFRAAIDAARKDSK